MPSPDTEDYNFAIHLQIAAIYSYLYIRFFILFLVKLLWLYCITWLRYDEQTEHIFCIIKILRKMRFCLTANRHYRGFFCTRMRRINLLLTSEGSGRFCPGGYFFRGGDYVRDSPNRIVSSQRFTPSLFGGLISSQLQMDSHVFAPCRWIGLRHRAAAEAEVTSRRRRSRCYGLLASCRRTTPTHATAKDRSAMTRRNASNSSVTPGTARHWDREPFASWTGRHSAARYTRRIVTIPTRYIWTRT